jgi:hypothetical protein
MNWCPLLKSLKRAEIRKDLLAHVNTDITTHCSAGELKALLEAVERLVKSDKLPPDNCILSQYNKVPMTANEYAQ